MSKELNDESTLRQSDATRGEAPRLARFSPEFRSHVWQKGQSGNPAGSPSRRREYRAAIDSQEGPERVLQVVDALFQRAVKGDVMAARLYLESLKLVGGRDEDAKLETCHAIVKKMLAEARAKLESEAGGAQ